MYYYVTQKASAQKCATQYCQCCHFESKVYNTRASNDQSLRKLVTEQLCCHSEGKYATEPSMLSFRKQTYNTEPPMPSLRRQVYNTEPSMLSFRRKMYNTKPPMPSLRRQVYNRTINVVIQKVSVQHRAVT